MTDTILLTGATGFLGTELAARLIRFPQIRLYALVRAKDEEASAGDGIGGHLAQLWAVGGE